MQRLQALNDQQIPAKTAIADSPFTKRLAEIRLRNRERREGGG
jgi:hypothetical protein